MKIFTQPRIDKNKRFQDRFETITPNILLKKFHHTVLSQNNFPVK